MICKRCVLDDTVPGIKFDVKGHCNYCTNYEAKKHLVFRSETQLAQLIKNIKNTNKQKCIIGISGGLDSSFLLFKAVELGLNPIAVHVDTGWNSETSVHNIEKLIRKLKVELITYVVDWEQFKKLQVAYLKSGVVDIEIPTDHYYLAALYKVANDLNIRHILTGNNHQSEGIMPDHWFHNKGDTMNMLHIYKQFSDGSSLNKLPTMTLLKRFYYYNIKKIENIFLLNYLPFNREEAKQILIRSFDWKEHPVKHGESIFTRFYHRHILFKRFNIDIRRAHLSSLICNQQISRGEALNILNLNPDENYNFENDKSYVLKKLGLSDTEFDAYMRLPKKNHSDFKSEIKIKNAYNILVRLYPFRYLLKISNRT